ncbi:MAG: hypothetical protein QOE27_1675 [Solirubrobacteraceae bacterium]|nr:hypothetical protein [Solirubrobacteraceae bacterium]
MVWTMRRLAASVVCSILLATASVAGAAARQTLAPPGNSGVDQYFETVPGAGGNVGVRPLPASAPTSAAGSGAPGRAASGQARALARFGADGRAAAAVAAATRPAGPGRPGSGSGSGPGSGPGPRGFAPPPKPTGAASALLTVLGGSDQGGLGIAFPLVLAGALAGAVLVLALRRRSPRPPG